MSTVELRVHGVHGTSPASMLGVSDGGVQQVAGDGLTGFYRVREGAPPQRLLAGTRTSVEAYSWGALTSGVQGVLGWVKRALWLLLLPFALVNMAYWARLELGAGSALTRWGARAVRVSGLLLTVFYVLTPCMLAVDLTAWQCFRYGVPGCEAVPGWLDGVGAWDAPRRLALATLVPMALVGVLWWLSRTTLQRYEGVTDALDRPPVLSQRRLLLHPRLWTGGRRTRRLQRHHLAAGVATVVAFTSVHLLRAGGDALTSGSRGCLVLTCALAFLLLAVTVAAVCVDHPDDVDQWPADPVIDEDGQDGGAQPSRTEVLDRAVAPAALALYLLFWVVAWTLTELPHRSLDERVDFFGRNVWFIGVFAALTVLHLAVFTGGRMRSGVTAVVVSVLPLVPVVVFAVLHLLRPGRPVPVGWVLLTAGLAVVFWAALNLWHYRLAPAHEAVAWRGAGASVLLAGATWIALLFACSAVVGVANWLNGPEHGVGDLVSRAQVADRGSDPTTVSLRDQRGGQFRTTGPAVLRDATIALEDGKATVLDGTVETTTLEVPVDQDVAPRRLDVQRGRTVLDHAGSVVVPTRVRVVDSCLVDSGSDCSSETDGFHPGGELRLAAQDADGGTTELALARGVVLDPVQSPQVPMAVPQVLIWATMAQLVWVVLVLALVGGCLWLFRRGAAAEIARHYAQDDSWLEPVAPRDRDRCVGARTSAAMAHRAETVLDRVGVVTSLVALVAVMMSLAGQSPWALPGLGFTRELATAAMALVLLLSAGLVALGSQLRRSDSTRKAVGVLWDLTTFWPRAAHPLGPPCYAERVVPELHVRARWVLDRDGSPPLPGHHSSTPARLVLSGHSQGSLIVVAAAARLNPVHLGRVRIVTYGSQVRALYGRVFPRVFGPDEIGYLPTSGTPRLRSAVPDLPAGTPGPPVPDPDTFRRRLGDAGGAWVNLFRRTDPLGWRVFSDVDSELDRPVPEVPDAAAGDPGPRVQGHGGYQHSAVYREQVARWTGETVQRPARDTHDVPGLPPN